MRQVGLHLVPVGWVAPCDVRVEVVVHGDGGALVRTARRLEDDRFVARPVPRIVSSIAVADHWLLSADELRKFPAGAVGVKKEEKKRKVVDIYRQCAAQQNLYISECASGCWVLGGLVVICCWWRWWFFLVGWFVSQHLFVLVKRRLNLRREKIKVWHPTGKAQKEHNQPNVELRRVWNGFLVNEWLFID